MKKQTLKKIGGIAVDVLIVVLLVAAVMVIIANIAAKRENGQANVFGYVISSVQTDSMSGTFEPGALVIGKIPEKDEELKVGDIIGFYEERQGQVVTITHRIIRVETVSNVEVYTTQGDNEKIEDQTPKTIHDVAFVYKTHIPGVGGFIDFLKKPAGFIICLLLPMLLFIGWQVYKIIDIYLKNKKEMMLEEMKEGVSDEAKDAIIREYLAKMQKEQESAAESTPEESSAIAQSSDKSEE
ncbi:MAG: signal peptidase I [Ruminococcaceae bacterium]|nr:signal peptidase I [Oscillospiraceae bacterium]